MSSSELVTLSVRSPHEAVEVSVLDGEFGVVAQGRGELDAALKPGIYELLVRVGPTQERRLLKLVGDHEERLQLADPHSTPDPEVIRLEIPSAAPIDGTSTTREPHMHAAWEASSALSGSGAPSGVVLMVRNLRDSRSPFDRDLAARARLLDSSFAPVQADERLGDDWATAVAPLEPGGYALRIDPPPGSPDPPTFQSVYAAQGWQTLVFIANLDAGLAPERAAIHVTNMYDPWQALSDRREIDLAVEAARWALREGRPGISPRLLRLLLETKFRNPMLGIVGAHVLLLDPRPNLDQLDMVIENLSNLVPDHPDVVALQWLLEDARGERPGASRAGEGISSPPMLLASYNAALRRDAYEPGAIVDGSPAEELAAHLVVTGIWTAWQRADAAPAPPPPARAAPDEGARGARRAPAPAAPSAPDPAAARVLEYVDSVAARRGQPRIAVLEKLDERKCALGTRLPTAVVRAALTQLRREGA